MLKHDITNEISDTEGDPQTVRLDKGKGKEVFVEDGSEGEWYYISLKILGFFRCMELRIEFIAWIKLRVKLFLSICLPFRYLFHPEYHTLIRVNWNCFHFNNRYFCNWTLFTAALRVEKLTRDNRSRVVMIFLRVRCSFSDLSRSPNLNALSGWPQIWGRESRA